MFNSMIEKANDSGNPQIARFSWLIEAFFDEAMGEMANAPTGVAEAWFHQLAQLVEWIASGNMDNIPDVQFPGQLAITSGSSESP